MLFATQAIQRFWGEPPETFGMKIYMLSEVKITKFSIPPIYNNFGQFYSLGSIECILISKTDVFFP